MKYDITKTKRPKMPKLGKGTECFKLLLSQTSFDMREPLLPMLPPVLGTKISNAEFQYPSGQWLEMCGQQAVLVADSAGNKGQLGLLVEAYNRDFREEDAEELKKYLQYQKEVLPQLVHHQLPPGCKDFSDYYLSVVATRQ